MSTAAVAKKRWTPEEYLTMERAALERHEYFDGESFAMAGCTGRHDRIAGNVFSALDRALENHLCEPFTSDMKIHIPATGSFTYSDGMVVCGPAYVDDVQDTLTNPCVIIEVLSDTTEAYDRGKKFEGYRSISALKDYVLVSQHKMLVEHFSRHADGTWTLRELRAAGDVLRLTAVPIEIAIEVVYRRLIFSP